MGAVVALAKPGMVYKLRYQNDGGGGHRILVRDWSSKIFPQQRNTDKITTKLTGSVCLQNTSRLGPDRTTGKWELQEPPYPASEETASPRRLRMELKTILWSRNVKRRVQSIKY